MTFTIREGDSLPALTVDLTDDNGAGVNLTTAVSVRLYVRAAASGAELVSNAPVTVEDQAVNPGRVTYTFTPEQTAVPGSYAAEWVVTWPDAKTQTFPTRGDFPVEIAADVQTTGAAVRVEALKAHLNITSSAHDAELQTSAHDAELQTFLDAAIDAVEGEVGPLAPRQVVQTFTGGGSVLLPWHGSILNVVGATYDDGTVIAPTDLVVTDGLLRWSPTSGGWWGTPSMTVTYVAGYDPVPAALRLAVLITAAGLWETQRGNAPGATALQGSADEPFVTGARPLIPPQAAALLAPYRASSTAGIA